MAMFRSWDWRIDVHVAGLGQSRSLFVLHVLGFCCDLFPIGF